MRSYPRTTAVLPAAQVLFDKLKVSLADIMGDKSPWDHGVIVIVRRDDGKFYPPEFLTVDEWFNQYGAQA